MLDHLSADQKRRALQLKREQEKRKQQKRFYTLFPDADTIQPDGSIIHARPKYPKHLEFFDAGARYRERCVMAANRCITPWTYLETETGERLSAEVWTSEDARVLAWDGGSECAAPAQRGILKCIEPAFRLVMGNGQFFDCTRKHRVLTTEGWLSLDQLVSRASGLRLWRRREDYQASCDADGYLGDQPLRSIGGIDLNSLLPQGGARQRAPLVFEPADAAERIFPHIHACPEPFRLSSLDDLRRYAALFALFSGASSARSCLSLSECTQGVLRLVRELGDQLRLNGAPRLDLFGVGDYPELGPTQSLDGSCRLIGWDAIRRSGALWCDVQPFGGSVQEWCRDDEHIAIFYPWDHAPFVGGQTIAAIVPLGLQPIIDAHVPKHNNYKAAGVFHHNTGKTFGMGGYETTCHLTGLYPDWWTGRRFATPVRLWAAGKTNETTRDIVQATLCGDIAYEGQRKIVTGTGLIPGALIGGITWKQGVADLIDTVKVKHVSGRNSLLGFKSYQQGRGAFEGTSQHGIWLDEEPPLDIYGECLIRTATTGGIIFLTFTPLEGMSETVLQFMPSEQRPDVA